MSLELTGQKRAFSKFNMCFWISSVLAPNPLGKKPVHNTVHGGMQVVSGPMSPARL